MTDEARDITIARLILLVVVGLVLAVLAFAPVMYYLDRYYAYWSPR